MVQDEERAECSCYCMPDAGSARISSEEQMSELFQTIIKSESWQ